MNRGKKLLEEEYGVKLYEKDGRGIRLAREGRACLRAMDPILSQVETLKSKFGSVDTDRALGSLKIGGTHSPSVSFLPILSVIFMETHPQVEIILRTDASRGIERLVLNGEAEIGVITKPSDDPSLIVEPFRQEKLVVFGSTRHPLAKNEKLTLAELAEIPLVIIRRGKESEGRVSKMIRRLEEQGHKLNIALYCESPEAAKAAVRSGMGLGILRHEIVEPEIKKGDLKVIKVAELKMTVDTYVIYHKGRSLSPYARDFLTLLHKWPQKTGWAKDSLHVV